MIVFLLSVGLMALVFVLMALRMLLKKGGKFPNTHIGGNKGLNARGITCATSMDRMEQREDRPRFDFKQYDETIRQSVSS